MFGVLKRVELKRFLSPTVLLSCVTIASKGASLSLCRTSHVASNTCGLSVFI